MPLDDSTLQFLAQPENLPLALEISKKVERLKVILHKQFWTAITAELRERLVASAYADHWHVINRHKPQKDYCSVGLKLFAADQPVTLFPYLQQGTRSGDYRFYFGLSWSMPFEERFDTPKVLDIRENLSRNGFNSTQWWPGIIYLDLWPPREKFLVGMANEEEVFIKKTTDNIWNLFIDYETLLTAVNEELAQLQ